MRRVRVTGPGKSNTRNPVARQLRTRPFLPKQIPDKRSRSRTVRGRKHQRDDLS